VVGSWVFFSFPLTFLSPRLEFCTNPRKKQLSCQFVFVSILILILLIAICLAFNAFWNLFCFQFCSSTFYFILFYFCIQFDLHSFYFYFFVFYYFLDLFFSPISPSLFFSLSFYIKFGPHCFDCYLFYFLILDN